MISWNIENLAHYLPGTARGVELAGVVHAFGPLDVLCLQEVRIRPSDRATIEAALAALPGYTCSLSLCRDPENGQFRGGRVYGVATYMRAELEGRPHALDWDREGRLSITLLDAYRLAIVNVYAVNGTSKPYYDHASGQYVGDRHAFKRRFNEQLLLECQMLQRRGFELVLIGDWNISRAALDTYPRLRTEEPHALARKLFNERFMPGLQVSDVFRERGPQLRKYTWFNRFARKGQLDAARVDFALVSSRCLERVLCADILDDPSVRFGSDHAPIELTLELAPGSQRR